MASGRDGEHERGRGPTPAVPMQGQALKAAETILAAVLKHADDEQLDHLPGPEEMMLVLQRSREFFDRQRITPPDDYLEARAVVARYVRDQINREDLATLCAMDVVKMPRQRQADAYGWEAPTAPRRRLKALEALFSEGRRTATGQVRRALRTGPSPEQKRARVRRIEDWLEARGEQLGEAAEELSALTRELTTDPSTREWLEDLPDSVHLARKASGNWSDVATELKIVVNDLRRQHAENPLPFEAAEAYERAAGLLEDLERASRG